MKICFSMAPFPKKNLSSQCFDTRKKTISYLWKCTHQKVCINHLISMVYYITFIILFSKFFKVMPLFSRTKSISKYTSIIIYDPSTKTKAALSNVYYLKPIKTIVCDRDGTDQQSANLIVLLMKVERPENLTLDKIIYNV